MTPESNPRKSVFLTVLVALPLFLTLLLLQIPLGVAQANCSSHDYQDCSGNTVYWFDSCDNQQEWVKNCNYNEECVGGVCQLKCGNDYCDAGENCGNCAGDCPCSKYEQCVYGNCQTWCGNSHCDSGENCNSCSDCRCPSSERCTYSGCETYCGNNQCDSDEGCSSCVQDCGCSSGEECTGGKCVSLCGNRRQDAGESCDTCRADFPCTGQYCSNGVCVECLSNTNCESHDTYSGEFICDPTGRKVLEKGFRTQGICVSNTCTGEKEPITRAKEDCAAKLCQDGHCGCNEGFAVCAATGKCERERALVTDQVCGCDLQCKSGYCNGDVCIDSLNVVLSSTKKIIQVGDEFEVTVSADNNLNEEVNLNLALNIGSGLKMTGVASGMVCSGNQCKSSGPISARGHQVVTVTLSGEGASQSTIGASAIYLTNQSGTPKERSIADISPLDVTIFHCGDGTCSVGETSQNCCGDCVCPRDGALHTYGCSKSKPSSPCQQKIKPIVYIVIAIILFVLTLAFLFGMPVIRYALEKKQKMENQILHDEEEEVKKKDEDARREHERARVKQMLEYLTDDIDASKPPSTQAVLDTLKKQYSLDIDPGVFSEEYFIFVERLKAQAAATAAALEKSKTKRAKFCTKCGYQTREGVKFCTICGTKVRFA